MNRKMKLSAIAASIVAGIAAIACASLSTGPIGSGTTVAGVPPTPQAPLISNIGVTSMTVSWVGGAPTASNSATVFYLVQVSVSNQSNFATVASNDVTITSITFTNLTPSTTYFFRIVAGDGKP